MKALSMNKEKHTIWKAFECAFSGMYYFFLYERNGKIHLAATIVVVILAVGLHLPATQWALLLLCIGIVICLEMVNCAIENLCNHVQEEFHPVIKIVKDVSAGAVLGASIISAVIAAIIFIPAISKIV